MTTAVCFDPEHIYHREDGHAEQPTRLTAVMSHLRETKRLERTLEVPVSSAPLEAIARVHDESYATMLEAFCVRGGGFLDVDTYATEASFRVARRALGGLLNVTDAVMRKRANNGFALIRPPGHHARPMAAMGFCLFSNVAIAARHIQAEYGVERVLIVDFDVHHGNGTQEVFYADPSVLLFDSHQSPAYPGSGGVGERGDGWGKGFTVNAPYPPGTGDKGLLSLYQRILPRLARRFRPDVVLVSAGFDAHHLDPLADAALSTSGYADLMRLVLEIADTYSSGRLVATMEGGYHPAALATCVRACLTVMEDPGAEIEDPIGSADRPEPDLSDLIADICERHRL
jgi:acetoin utilization deacetylase AcuC-like enzyme